MKTEPTDADRALSKNLVFEYHPVSELEGSFAQRIADHVAKQTQELRGTVDEFARELDIRAAISEAHYKRAEAGEQQLAQLRARAAHLVSACEETERCLLSSPGIIDTIWCVSEVNMTLLEKQQHALSAWRQP